MTTETRVAVTAACLIWTEDGRPIPEGSRGAASPLGSGMRVEWEGHLPSYAEIEDLDIDEDVCVTCGVLTVSDGTSECQCPACRASK